MIPTPERVKALAGGWYVWFAVADGTGGRRLKLTVVPR